MIDAATGQVSRANEQRRVIRTPEQIGLRVKGASAGEPDSAKQVTPSYLSRQVAVSRVQALPDGRELVVVGENDGVERALREPSQEVLIEQLEIERVSGCPECAHAPAKERLESHANASVTNALPSSVSRGRPA